MKIDLAQDLSFVRFTIQETEHEVAEAFQERFNLNHPCLKVGTDDKGRTVINIARTGFGIALRFMEMLGTTDPKAQSRMGKLYCNLLWVQEQDALGTDVSEIIDNMKRGNGGEVPKLR